MFSTHKRSVIMFALGICLMLVSAAALAQTPADAVAAAVANSGVFPAGTTVVSVTSDDTSVVVDLSAEAITPNFGDTLSDDMVEAITDALTPFDLIRSIEVTVGGQPLWAYLPSSTAPDGSGGTGLQSLGAETMGSQMGFTSIGGGGGAGSGVAALTSELAGKGVGLYPSHGMYWHQGYNRWFISMRTLCGPNPSPPRPAGWDPLWQSVYQPSNYYYWTRQFQWGSFYEDYRTPQEIRFLRAYCESSGANVLVGRNLDKEAGDFDYNAYGYPNCSYPIPKWATAAKYHLQEYGAPEAVWNEPSLSAQTDKDIRARPYWTNYNMVEPIFGAKKWPLTAEEKVTVQNRPDVWQNWVSIHLHTNAAGSGTARGTETYWYTSTYPWLQAKAQALAAAFNNGMINAIKNEYDGFWAEAMYPVGPNPPEWPSGTYRGYDHDGPSTPSTTSGWQNRGVKTTSFGEIREAMVPAVLTELLFHDDWKFYPDHVFAMDQIFQSTVAWGMYEGICNYFGVTPKARLAAAVESVSFPTLVGPNAAISGMVTLKNLGQAWCWGDKWADMLYFPYTVWFLQCTADDQFGAAGTKLALPNDGSYYPGDTAEFAVSLTAPAATGLYTTSWQMLKDDQRGGSFGDVATAQIQVDADAPEITITSPAAQDYPYGCVTVGFSAVDALSEVVSLTADIDGTAVVDGQVVCNLALGAHTLTVTAVDTFGNSASQSVTFNIVNSVGLVSVGGWIELVDKKATCGFTCQYVQGDPAPSGSLTYQDHDTGMTVHSDNMVAMGIVGNRAWFYGTCTIEGEPGHWFRVDVTDNGEPGSNDVFNISLDTGYSQGGTLGGGNVQVL